MDDKLSQAEIDQLISAMGSGEDKFDQLSASVSQKIKNYDFKRPNKFSKDHINTLNNIHENYTRALASNLSGNLKAVVDTQLISIEQVTYSEFINSLPNPTILGVCELNPMGSIVVDVSPSLAFMMIDRLLGGQGESVENLRNLTQIERLLIERRVKEMIQLLPEAWENILPIKANLLSIETTPQFIQIVGATEMVALITVEVKLVNGTGFVHICLPFVILEPVLSKLTTQVWFTNKRQYPGGGEGQIRKRLDNVGLEVMVNLGKVLLNVQDLLNLTIGDVLPLETKVTDPLEIIIGSGPKFLGVPGTSGNRVAVQLIGKVSRGDEG